MRDPKLAQFPETAVTFMPEELAHQQRDPLLVRVPPAAGGRQPGTGQTNSGKALTLETPMNPHPSRHKKPAAPLNYLLLGP